MAAAEAETPAPAGGPLARYRARVASGELKGDPEQEAASARLDDLARAVDGWQARSASAGGWLSKLGLRRSREAAAPTGLYLFGPVGRGKSMLMDLFFEAAPVAAKRRVHFHEFMQEVHGLIHRFRQAGGAGDSPILQAAASVADQVSLLCFDEMEVRDIADAMILARLFTALFERGVVVVTTSNRPPDDLYKGGLHRDRFLPFIELLKERLDVVDLGDGTDYRRDRLVGETLFFTPADAAARAALDRLFAELTGGAEPEPDSVVVHGRELEVAHAAKGVARFGFEELCARPLGPADFLALARRYRAVLIDDVPLMTDAIRDRARRFMLLIDSLYERRVTLVCSAAAEAEKLYAGSDWGFEFDRTVSRLMEMRSADYFAEPHRP
ncbi:cell division protein ZapE [Thalassobaculum fulvum]|uniref:Cell division protein ZapE n=1 Tax=Thalassobaculum fulvum TaxID=1633335 RepID=A0A918XNB3_9PROT|nr:cell division protein ZapE [Thalassobaculum fulvum]GHD39215.1 cell division protein ZapE [Thalassobaculum fulvum]